MHTQTKGRTLTTIGLPVRFDLLIKSHLKLVNARTIDHWSFSEETTSDVAICDPQSPLCASALRRAGAVKPPVCIPLVNMSRVPRDGTLSLHESLHATDLIKVLDRISTGPEDIKPPDSPAQESREPVADAHAVHPFPRVLHNLMIVGSHDLHLVESDSLRFCVLPVSRCVYLPQPLSDAWLEKMLNIGSDFTVVPIPVAERQQVLGACPYRATLAKLLWHAGISNADAGGLMFDENAPVSIRRWPDFGNLKHKPVHLRMAAELSHKYLTVAELTEVTHASIEQVRTFVNACAMCDLLKSGDGSDRPERTRAATPAATRAQSAPALPQRRSFGFLHAIRAAIGLSDV